MGQGAANATDARGSKKYRTNDMPETASGSGGLSSIIVKQADSDGDFVHSNCEKVLVQAK